MRLFRPSPVSGVRRRLGQPTPLGAAGGLRLGGSVEPMGPGVAVDLARGGPSQLATPGARHPRLLALAVGLLVAFGAIVARAGYVQIVRADELSARHARVSVRDERLPPLRGDIVDRDGRVLAVSRWRPGLRADTRAMGDVDRAALARTLSRSLAIDEAVLRHRLSATGPHVLAARGLSETQLAAAEALAHPAVRIERERLRVYPSWELEGRALAASYIGISGVAGKGLSGIELAFEERLHGRSEVAHSFRNGTRKKWIEQRAPQGARRGATVRLALDAELQHAAERAIASQVDRCGAIAGTIVVINPHDGDLLAVAEYPSFDPNYFWLENQARLHTRAFEAVFEPGSSVKPLVVALGLDAGVVRLDDEFDTKDGAKRVIGQMVRDTSPHGVLDLAGIIRVSSNIGAAEIGARLGPERLVEGLRRLGLGQRTGAGFPSEAIGHLADLVPRQQHELTRLAFGHGLSASAVQLAVAESALANGGWRITPRLVLAIDGVPVPRAPRVRALSEWVADSVRDMMRGVVEAGTGRAAALEHYTVAGKTGTAEKFVEGAYARDRVVASFVGMVPASDPRLVVVVAIDEPKGSHSGGAVAAPVFREFAEVAMRLLAVPSDVVAGVRREEAAE